MKKRLFYVSNSSSSSFCIAIKDITSVPEIENAPSWVNKMIHKMYDMITCDGEQFNTIEELNKNFIERYGYDETIEELLEEDPSLLDSYNKMKEAIEKGYIVSDINIDHNDESKSEMLETLPKKDDGSGIYLISYDC